MAIIHIITIILNVGILFSRKRQYNKAGGILLMMVFDPLWKTMKEKKVTIYALVVKHGVSKQAEAQQKCNTCDNRAFVQNSGVPAGRYCRVCGGRGTGCG